VGLVTALKIFWGISYSQCRTERSVPSGLRASGSIMSRVKVPFSAVAGATLGAGAVSRKGISVPAVRFPKTGKTTSKWFEVVGRKEGGSGGVCADTPTAMAATMRAFDECILR